MPTNTEINLSLVAGTVPPDRSCPKNGQDVVNLVQDFVSVQSGTSSGDSTNPGDSVAEQALNTANTALAAVQELQSAQKEVRSSQPIAIPTGDSNFVMPLIPPMPSTDYDVYVTYYAGAVGFIAAPNFYSFRVLESSITVNGFNILFDNTPANTKASIRVVQR
jgi:hypothetical protein